MAPAMMTLTSVEPLTVPVESVDAIAVEKETATNSSENYPKAMVVTTSQELDNHAIIIDSGAADHIKGVAVDGICQPCDPLTFETSNGYTKCSTCTEARIPVFNGMQCIFRILKGTPPILSMGKICTYNPWTFTWTAFAANPYFVHQDTGEIIQFQVRDYVPFVTSNAYMDHKSAYPILKTDLNEVQRLVNVLNQESTDGQMKSWVYPRKNAYYFEGNPESIGGPDLSRTRRRLTVNMDTLEIIGNMYSFIRKRKLNDV